MCGEQPIQTWKEMEAVMRKCYVPSYYYRVNQTDWKRLQDNFSYSKRRFWEKEEQPKKVCIRTICEAKVRFYELFYFSTR